MKRSLVIGIGIILAGLIMSALGFYPLSRTIVIEKTELREETVFKEEVKTVKEVYWEEVKEIGGGRIYEKIQPFESTTIQFFVLEQDRLAFNFKADQKIKMIFLRAQDKTPIMWENIDALNEEWVAPYDGICTFELFPGSSVEVGFSYSIIRYAQKTGKIYELRSKIVSYTENVPHTEKVPHIVTVEEQEEYTET